MLEESLSNFSDIHLDHVHHGPGGYQNVFVTFNSPSESVSDRGARLLEVEDYLMKNVSESIRVWHVPIGDKNSLRNLRGVTLK